MDQLTLATAFKMTVALGFVLLTFGASIFIAKKFAGGKPSFLNKGNKPNVRPLEVIAFQSLGPGKNLYLVRCHNKKILVGATGQQICHVADINETEELDESHSEFQSTLSEKLPEKSEARAKGRFSSLLKDISRV